ncbi:hypothetical protein ABPG72_018846 [Tetrahymena utriculariae]
MVKQGQEKQEISKSPSSEEQQKEEIQQSSKDSDQSSSKINPIETELVQQKPVETNKVANEGDLQQIQKVPSSENAQKTELNIQKQSSLLNDEKGGDSSLKVNTQLKIEQNLNSAFSAMGGFMSGIINKVQQGASSSLGQNQSTLHRRQKNEDFIQEREVLMQSAQNRKSSVYSLLKEWDQSRINSLNIHRNIIESILGRVDQRMKASQENLTGITLFVKVVGDQIKNAASVNLPNISNGHIYKSVYDKIYEAIHKFENSTLEMKKKALTFHEKVEVEIHQGLIAAEAEHYSNTIATIRTNLLNLKRSLHDQQLKVTRKSIKVKDVYTHNSDSSKKPKKDFQKSLYSFLLACQDFRDLQVILAKATVGFWKKAIELEKQRSKAIQKIVNDFLHLHQTYVANQGLPTYLTQDLVQTLQQQVVTDEFIVNHMDFNSIISPEDQIYISTQLKKPKKITVPAQISSEGKQEVAEQGVYDISIQEVYYFLTKIYYPQFDDIGLAHKKMQVQREFPKEHFKNTTILITPDSFLLCYDEQAQQNNQNSQHQQTQQQQQQQQQHTQDQEEEHKEQLKQEQQQLKEHQGQVQEEIKKVRTSSTQIEDEQYQILFYQRQPDYQMQIQQITLKRNGLALDLKSSSKSSFMQLLYPSSEIKFLFKTSDQMEEFIQIIQALQEISD